jgi:hypothetical protein
MNRSTTPPPAPPSDVARLRVALWKTATVLGIDLDSSMADHQIAELIEHRLNKGIARRIIELSQEEDAQSET